MSEFQLRQEQSFWEEKEANAQRAVDYAGRQLERIAQRIVEMQSEGHRHLNLVRDTAQVILLHGGECE